MVKKARRLEIAKDLEALGKARPQANFLKVVHPSGAITIKLEELGHAVS